MVFVDGQATAQVLVLPPKSAQGVSAVPIRGGAVARRRGAAGLIEPRATSGTRKRPPTPGAILLIRLIETAVGESWPAIREQLQRLHRAPSQTRSAPSASDELTTGQKKILSALDLPEPQRVHKVKPSSP